MSEPLSYKLAYLEATKELTQLRQQNAELVKEHDKEIGDFQNLVRDKIIEWTGAPDYSIDGKGSDAGWEEFTLTEIQQGISFLKEQNASLTQQLAESEASRERMRNCIEIIGSQNHNLECPNCSVCEAVDKALSEPSSAALKALNLK